jgi:hypothetical protein
VNEFVVLMLFTAFPACVMDPILEGRESNTYRGVDEPAKTLVLKGGKSAEIANSQIGGIRISGEWGGPIRISGVSVVGECSIIGVKAMSLTIVDCNLRHGLKIENVDIDHIQIVSARFRECGIKIIDSRIVEVDIISPASDRWLEFSEPFVAERFERIWTISKDIASAGTSRFDAVTIERCTIKDRLAIGGDVIVPAVSVLDTRVPNLYISNRGHVVGTVECRRLTIRHRMGLDFQALPARLLVEDCVVEDGKLRFSGWRFRFDESQISFARSSFTFDECPMANDITATLDQKEVSPKERIRILQKLKRFYLETGQPREARIVTGRLSTESLKQSSLTELPGHVLDWMSSGEFVFTRLVGAWFGLLFVTMAILMTAALCKCQVAVGGGYTEGMSKWYQVHCAIRVALDSACPVPLDDDLVLSMFAFTIHASNRLLVWVLILLGAKALTGY